MNARRSAITVAAWLVVTLLAARLGAPSPACGQEGDRRPAGPSITLEARNEPLRSVLARLSEQTRWRVEAPEAWLERPVTQALQQATLEEGLRALLRSAGIESILLLFDEQKRLVTAFDTETPKMQAAGRPPVAARPEPRMAAPPAPSAPGWSGHPGQPPGDAASRAYRRSRRAAE